MEKKNQKKDYSSDIRYYNTYANYQLELLVKKIKGENKSSKANIKMEQNYSF